MELQQKKYHISVLKKARNHSLTRNYRHKTIGIIRDANKRMITGSYLVLTANIPDSEADVFVFHRLHIEPWVHIRKYHRCCQLHGSMKKKYIKIIN